MEHVYKRIDPSTVVFDTAKEGEFRATFSTFNVVDLDGDVTLPGAFKNGQQVRIAQWGHNWGALPIGRGVIDSDQSRAWVDGAFLMTTQAGRDTYETVKSLDELQEWSYGFDIERASSGKFADNPFDVRFLEALDVIEVSPVMLGAGIDTGTDAIKALLDMSLTAGSNAVLAAARELTVRYKSLADLRAKEGRVLSEANRARLKEHATTARQIADDLDALYEATAPAPKLASAGDVRRASLDLVRLELDGLVVYQRV